MVVTSMGSNVPLILLAEDQVGAVVDLRLLRSGELAECRPARIEQVVALVEVPLVHEAEQDEPRLGRSGRQVSEASPSTSYRRQVEQTEDHALEGVLQDPCPIRPSGG